MSPTAVHFGAGNIGRGFIGALLSKSDYHVTFADVFEPLIKALNEEHKYKIHILDVNPSDPVVEVTNVSGVMSSKSHELLPAVCNADLVTTAVGPSVLKIIARSLASAIIERKKCGTKNLNIIACENLAGASTHLHDEILKHLESDEDKAYLEEYVGFPNCAVDRIVPPFSGGENILSVGVEEFFEWIVEEPKFKGDMPEIKGMKLTDNLVAYLQRKMFTLNCGHATCAYLGNLKGYATVDEAFQDMGIERVVYGAMCESGKALCKKHGFEWSEHEKYIKKIMSRFRNPYIKDQVGRVGRDPLRKLAPADRLVGPTKMAREFGLPVDNLLKGIAAALWYDNPEDNQSVDVRSRINQGGLEILVNEVLGFKPESDDSKAVIAAYEELGRMKQKL